MANSCETGQGGSSGGVAVLAKRHLNFRFLDSFQLQGKGFVLAVARFAGSDVVFGSLYLETGQDLSTPTNAAILAKLVATLQALAAPWLVAGDFNCDLDTIRQTRLAEATNGAFIGAGEATCSTGGQIDYVWVHTRLQGLTEVSVDSAACGIASSSALGRGTATDAPGSEEADWKGQEGGVLLLSASCRMCISTAPPVGWLTLATVSSAPFWSMGAGAGAGTGLGEEAPCTPAAAGNTVERQPC